MKTLAEFINEQKSVAAAARSLGVSRQTIDRWQKGKFKPSRAQAELARLKEVDLVSAPVVIPTSD